jgi:phosphatidylglycerol---prolipoprotein diacylglyceryl transferase
VRIIHDFDPFIWRITGDFGIRWYSLPYILGFLLVHWRLSRAAERREIPGLDQDRLDRFILYALVAVLLGARFFHVFVFEFHRYGFDPYAWIAVWRGGLSFHGGFLGAILVTWLFGRAYGIPLAQLTDRMAVPVAITLGFGRIANFINAEMYGIPWDGPLCVDYSMNRFMAFPPEECRHPTQLYQMAKNWAIAGVVAWQWRRWRPRPGIVSWTFIGLYGGIRFLLMFLRQEELVWAGLTLSQIFSGLMALTAAVAIAVILSRPRDLTPPASAAGAPGRDGPAAAPRNRRGRRSGPRGR